MARTTAQLDGAAWFFLRMMPALFRWTRRPGLPGWSTHPHSCLPPARSGRPAAASIAYLIASGTSNAEVARALLIAISTIKTHTNSIFSKFQVTSGTQTIGLARDLDLLSSWLSPRP